MNEFHNCHKSPYRSNYMLKKNDLEPYYEIHSYTYLFTNYDKRNIPPWSI